SIHKANQDIIYALSSSIIAGPDLNADSQGDFNNALHAVFKSTDGGESWLATTRNTNPDKMSAILLHYPIGVYFNQCSNGEEPNYYYGAGWYDQLLAVDPVNPDVVWVGGLNLFRSDDGGESFGFLVGNDISPSYPGGDMHVLKFHPEYDGVSNSTVVVGSDAGLRMSKNANAEVVYDADAAFCGDATDGLIWENINNNYGVTQFYAGAVFSGGASYMAGAQDVGNWMGNDIDGSNNWRFLFPADGGYMAIDPRNEDHIFATSIRSNFKKSTDRGESWRWHGSQIQDLPIVIMPFEMDPNNPDRLWAAATRLWRSDNQGDYWYPASAAIDGEVIPSGVSFPISTASASAMVISPHDSNIVLVANQLGIYRHETAAEPVQHNTDFVKMNSPREGWVSSLMFDPLERDTVYATYSTYGGKHIWKSIDKGMNWVAIDGVNEGQLPDFPVHKLVINPKNTQQLYIGTESGVFVSLDGGLHWAVENTGFSNVIVEFLVIDESEDEVNLFAFTFGRGAWKVPLSDLEGINGYEIDDQVSGSWYLSEQSGHGLILQVLENDSLLAFWFVYHQGEQFWLVGNGHIEGNHVSIDLSKQSGADFPPDFNSSDVVSEPWGNLDVVFADGSNMGISWNPKDGSEFTPASMKMTKLTTISSSSDNAVQACHSGAWYDPEQNGHGFIVEVIEINGVDHMLVYWFTFDNGKPIWLLGQGEISGDVTELSTVITTGAFFPPAFQSSDVSQQPWGTMSVEFTDENNGMVSWHPSLEGYASGSLNIKRLTQLAGQHCSTL
ncbi:MAG: hypothetical protein JKY19_14780, partial [Alcanivoracaceae bacterium]|nr:hypothetical protein [Alcanivoracaceae bacterium]